VQGNKNASYRKHSGLAEKGVRRIYMDGGSTDPESMAMTPRGPDNRHYRFQPNLLDTGPVPQALPRTLSRTGKGL